MKRSAVDAWIELQGTRVPDDAVSCGVRDAKPPETRRFAGEWSLRTGAGAPPGRHPRNVLSRSQVADHRHDEQREHRHVEPVTRALTGGAHARPTQAGGAAQTEDETPAFAIA